MKFYECKTCGNVMVLFEDYDVIPVCCGNTMDLINPLSKDGAYEKHVPIIARTGNNIEIIISSVPHPMLEEHYIKWIVLETNKGMYIRNLKPKDEPKAKFVIQEDERPLRAYEFCSVHSLWLSDYEEE